MPRKNRSLPYILPNELLIIIFKFCDAYTLSQICLACKQFYTLAITILNKKGDYVLITNQMSSKFRERCKPLLSSSSEKFLTYYNWVRNRCEKSMICELSSNYYLKSTSTCLQMSENMIWHYYNTRLHAHYRGRNGTVIKNKHVVFCDSFFGDITYCNGEIISGHDDGSIRRWKIESHGRNHQLKHIQILNRYCNVHNKNANHIDATTQYIISSSSDSLKIQKNIRKIYEEYDWDYAEENQILYSYCTNKNVVKSISIDPTETKFAASTDLPAILIYDIDKSYPVIDKQDDLCLQLLWEDPHTILMCGKHYIKKMDMRTCEFVRTWAAISLTPPYFQEDFFTCFSSDNTYTILTGTNYEHAILWDQRQNTPIQRYNVGNEGSYNSIYSVQFDSMHMYAVTQQGLFELNFQK